MIQLSLSNLFIEISLSNKALDECKFGFQHLFLLTNSFYGKDTNVRYFNGEIRNLYISNIFYCHPLYTVKRGPIVD